MRLTLLLTATLLLGFWLTNFALYFEKMDLMPASVEKYYLGNEEEYRMPRTYQSMIEVTHMRLPMMAMVVLLLAHLLVFAPFTQRVKVTFIVLAFACAFFNDAAGWLVRFVHPEFRWLKVIAFVGLQSVLAFLLGSLGWFLLWGKKKGERE